jgi:2-polyprenyl-6-methoxyphenol hydroxylase-like FAD-dependent oxidoreductase
MKRGHAVVVGGSMAGCLAARVLADRFESVTVVEQYERPEPGRSRRGVPQENHVHLLLVRGREILEALYPGFVAELEARGACTADLSADIRCQHYGLWKDRYETGICAHYCSRALLDQVTRERTERLANVAVAYATKAVALTGGPERRVRGVRIAGARTGELAADLVVDASGGGSRAGKWLNDLGYRAPSLEEVPSRLGYASRIYRRHPDFAGRWKVLLLLPDPPKTRRLGVVSPIEGDRWMVTLGGCHGDYPAPRTEEFVQFAKELPSGELHEVISQAEPLSAVSGYGMRGGVRIRFEHVSEWPAGFLMIGDAISRFNPFYSQGLTVCAMEADALRTRLEPGPEAVWADALGVQRAIAAASEPAWSAAKSEDLRFSEDEDRPVRLRLLHWYTAHAARAAARNREIATRSLRVTNFLEDANTLLGFSAASRVLAASLARSFESRRPPT